MIHSWSLDCINHHENLTFIQHFFDRVCLDTVLPPKQSQTTFFDVTSDGIFLPDRKHLEVKRNFEFGRSSLYMNVGVACCK